MAKYFLLLLLNFGFLLFVACSQSEIDNSYETSGRKNYDLGIFHLELGAYQEAAEEFQQALSYNPKHPIYLMNYGYALYRLKLYQKAESYFQEALQVEPKLKEAWYNLALTYEAQGKNSDAVLAFQKYEELIFENSP